jgi:beta-glucuronidase
MKRFRLVPPYIYYFIILLSGYNNHAHAQSAMINVYGRNAISINGEWKSIPDPTGAGEWRQVWKERIPQKKTDFVEYSFEGGPTLQVPGDFNTQIPELFYVEGPVWYKQTFQYTAKPGKRLFLHFGAVNYLADVYLNGMLLGKHEGGFTPFQFELTGKVTEGENRIIVKTNNERLKNGLPGLGYDWFNYGGITRDVHLIETNETFIEDYSIQLKKSSTSKVLGWVKLNGSLVAQNIRIKIPELKIDHHARTDGKGFAPIMFDAKFHLWEPSNPKLYKVIIQSETDSLTDEIGFRNIEVKGNKVLLNGKPIFLKGVNIHEERPMQAVKATSEADAAVLLSWAKELGCNFIRLVHYPHNEHMVRLAEKMGLIVWDELPAYQHIEFADSSMPSKLNLMMKEMIRRDRNRCSVMFWSLSNETYTTTPGRTNALVDLTKECRSIDSTRLITSVLSNQRYQNHTIDVWDTLVNHLDLIAINEYLGWYVPWQGKPSDTRWKLITQKPVIITEFGGEAKYGSNYGPKDAASSWSEEYQEQIYKDQVEMFATVPNLIGVCPWLLVDYRSTGRMHPVYQKGFNRKGLLSEHGEKKKAWYIMNKYYSGN